MADETTPETPVTPPTPPPAPKPETPDLARAIEGLLAKHAGNPTQALQVLMNENYGYRDTIRDLKEKAPAKGSIVLSPDDAKTWTAYGVLGKPGDLRKALDEGAVAKGEADGFRREKVNAAVATVTGFKPSVLHDLATRDKLEFEVKDGTDKLGKPIKVAHVLGQKNDKGEDLTVTLADYAAKHWADYLSSLTGQTAPAPQVLGSPSRNGTEPPKPTIAPEVRPRSLVR